MLSSSLLPQKCHGYTLFNRLQFKNVFVLLFYCVLRSSSIRNEIVWIFPPYVLVPPDKDKSLNIQCLSFCYEVVCVYVCERKRGRE